MAAEEKWYFTKEQLANTPSRRCGCEADKELSNRQQAANFIQDMGQRLQVTQLCINTAIVYMHRFYVYHSFTHFHRNAIATAALFLAAKVEEQPRKLEHVIKVAHVCLRIDTNVLDTKSDSYLEQAQDLVFNENVLLQTLSFDVAIDHPHTHVVRCCHMVKASKDLAQTSYFMASNSLHLTTMCLQYKPTVVACFCIHLACKWSNWEIPQSNEGKDWFSYVDKSVTFEQLEQLTTEFLQIFDKCPTKLKRKIMAITASQNQIIPSQTGQTSQLFDSEPRKITEMQTARHPMLPSLDDVTRKAGAAPPAKPASYSIEQYKEKREKERAERVKQTSQSSREGHHSKAPPPPPPHGPKPPNLAAGPSMAPPASAYRPVTSSRDQARRDQAHAREQNKRDVPVSMFDSCDAADTRHHSDKYSAVKDNRHLDKRPAKPPEPYNKYNQRKPEGFEPAKHPSGQERPPHTQPRPASSRPISAPPAQRPSSTNHSNPVSHRTPTAPRTPGTSQPRPNSLLQTPPKHGNAKPEIRSHEQPNAVQRSHSEAALSHPMAMQRSHLDAMTSQRHHSEPIATQRTHSEQLGTQRPIVEPLVNQRPHELLGSSQRSHIEQLSSQRPHVDQIPSQRTHIEQKSHLDQISSQKSHLDQISSQKSHLDQISSQKSHLDQISSQKSHLDQMSSQRPHLDQIPLQRPHVEQSSSQRSHPDLMTSHRLHPDMHRSHGAKSEHPRSQDIGRGLADAFRTELAKPVAEPVKERETTPPLPRPIKQEPATPPSSRPIRPENNGTPPMSRTIKQENSTPPISRPSRQENNVTPPVSRQPIKLEKDIASPISRAVRPENNVTPPIPRPIKQEKDATPPASRPIKENSITPPMSRPIKQEKSITPPLVRPVVTPPPPRPMAKPESPKARQRSRRPQELVIAPVGPMSPPLPVTPGKGLTPHAKPTNSRIRTASSSSEPELVPYITKIEEIAGYENILAGRVPDLIQPIREPPNDLGAVAFPAEANGTEPSPSVASAEAESPVKHKSEKKKKKEKRKHKEKDKDRPREEKKKKHKHKDKDKDKDKNREANNEVSMPIKITIPKEKIMAASVESAAPQSLKITITKDRIKNMEPPPAIKLKISKDIIETYTSPMATARKRKPTPDERPSKVARLSTPAHNGKMDAAGGSQKSSSSKQAH